MPIITALIIFVALYCWWATRPRIVVDGVLWRIIARTKLAIGSPANSCTLELSDASGFPAHGEILIGKEILTYEYRRGNRLGYFISYARLSAHACGEWIFGVK